MTLTLGSLFAGIGGFDLGFERAGVRTVWQCEIDKAAQGVLRKWFPGAALHSDVREVGAHNLEPVDVVTFGSPCQNLSLAGKRAGLAGAQSGLFFEAVRIIRELRERHGKPDFAIWENVPGAFSSNGGKDFEAVVQAMVDLGARDVCWRVLDSRYFGVAQRRRRVFLVADFGGERAQQVLFEPEGLRGDSKKGGAKRKETARGTGAGAAGGGGKWPADVSATLNTAYGTKMGLEDQHALNGASMFVPAQPIAFHPTQDPISSEDGVTHAMSSGNRQGCGTVAVCATGQVTHALTCGASDGATEDGTGRGTPITAQAFNGYQRTVDNVTWPLGTQTGGIGGGVGGAFVPPMQVRRLVPIETERLQAFPDGWTAEVITPDGTLKPQADGPRYKQLGNAVTVNVAEWIAKRLVAAVGVE